MKKKRKKKKNAVLSELYKCQNKMFIQQIDKCMLHCLSMGAFLLLPSYLRHA